MSSGIMVLISFGCLIVSFLIWLRKDQNAWNDLSGNLKTYYAKTIEYQREAKAAEDSANALRKTVVSYKMQIDSYKAEDDLIRDHLQRIQQSFLLLEHKNKTLSDQVHGFSIKMPESISITLTKDVKSATTCRDNKRKSVVSIKNSKVRQAKVATKASRRT